MHILDTKEVLNKRPWALELFDTLCLCINPHSIGWNPVITCLHSACYWARYRHPSACKLVPPNCSRLAWVVYNIARWDLNQTFPLIYSFWQNELGFLMVRQMHEDFVVFHTTSESTKPPLKCISAWHVLSCVAEMGMCVTRYTAWRSCIIVHIAMLVLLQAS